MADPRSITAESASIIHHALADIARNAWKHHGVVIESVKFGWNEVGSMDGKREMLLTSVNVESTTKPI